MRSSTSTSFPFLSFSSFFFTILQNHLFLITATNLKNPPRFFFLHFLFTRLVFRRAFSTLFLFFFQFPFEERKKIVKQISGHRRWVEFYLDEMQRRKRKKMRNIERCVPLLHLWINYVRAIFLFVLFSMLWQTRINVDFNNLCHLWSYAIELVIDNLYQILTYLRQSQLDCWINRAAVICSLMNNIDRLHRWKKLRN